MDEWIEEDLACQAGVEADAAERVLDRRMLRQPIWRLQPRTPLSLPPSATLLEAIHLMRSARVGCVLVVERDRLVGILTERDLLLKLDRPDFDQHVAELMTPDPEVLRPGDPIVYALNKMSVGGFRHIPLVDARGRAVGIVSVKDIVDYLVELFPDEVLTVPPDPARAGVWHGRDGG
ncbi:MAG: CBS domain-containing protein [Candidatus Binatia bacterium]